MRGAGAIGQAVEQRTDRPAAFFQPCPRRLGIGWPWEGREIGAVIAIGDLDDLHWMLAFRGRRPWNQGVVISFDRGALAANSEALRNVVSLIVPIASRVRKAWWPVTITFGKAIRRCSTSSVMMVLDKSWKNSPPPARRRPAPGHPVDRS